MTLGDALNTPLPETLRPDQLAAKPTSGAGLTATPVMNPSVLQALVEHAGGSAAARFADDFLNLFEDRLTHVDAALAKADPESALKAVLSLKASSAMLGAEQMTLYCAGLERELRGQRIPHAGALPRLAADFTAALAGAIAHTFPQDAKTPASAAP